MHNKELAEIAIERATAALDLRRPQQALLEAGQAVTQDPSNERGFAVLCRAHLGLSRFPEAQRAAEDGLALAPDSEWLHRLRFWALYGQERFTESLAEADEAVACAPEVGSAHYCRSLALSRLGQHSESVAAVREALQYNPQDADFHAHLGLMSLNEAPDLAEQHLRTSLSINPLDAVVLNNLGAALERQKKQSAALVAYKSAILIDPTLKVAKANLLVSVTNAIRFSVSTLLIIVLQIGLRSALEPAKWIPATSAIPIPWAELVSLAAVIGILAFCLIYFLYPWLRLRELKREDPQIFELYKKLRADKRAGRL